MHTKTTNTFDQSKSIMRVLLVTALVLAVPAVAMRFTSEVNWSAGDFAIAGILLTGTGLVYELGIKRLKNARRRLIMSVALVLAFLLVWAELAVGIIGTPFAGN